MTTCSGCDFSAMGKSFSIVILSIVMLICYGSAFAICEELDWNTISNVDYSHFSGSECRFSFYDRTFKWNSYQIFTGHVFVVYYILTWAVVFFVAVLAVLALALKCGPCIRRTLSLGLIAACVVVILSDFVSMWISSGNYNKGKNSSTSLSENTDIDAARNTYIGLNLVVLIMQTYMLLNAAYDIADNSDQTEEEVAIILKSYDEVYYDESIVRI